MSEQNVMVEGQWTPLARHVFDPFILHDEHSWHATLQDHGFGSHAHASFVLPDPEDRREPIP